MQTIVQTVIIGYIPLTNAAGKKSRELRDDQYFKNILADFDIGEVHFATQSSYQEVIAAVNPFVIIVFDESAAQQVKNYKKDAFIYIIDPPGTIFYRKATATTKQAEQRKIFQQIAGLVQQIRNEDDNKLEIIRKVAGLGYKETYDMLIRAAGCEREDLRKRAWQLLTDNNAPSAFIWMRAQLVTEVWNYGDGKIKEKFLCLAMDQHIENGLAHQLADFTDAEGQVFHQYMFHHVNGEDANCIRRIPVGEKGQNKYTYEAILEKYGTPNGPQMMLEAGQYRTERDEYIKREAEKIPIEKQK